MYLRLGCCYPSVTGARDSLGVPFFPIAVEFHMANIKSQKKRNRQNEVRRQRNKSVMSNLRTSVNKVTAAAAAGEPTEELFRQAQEKIDTAAAQGVLHPKTAARKKSRLAAQVANK